MVAMKKVMYIDKLVKITWWDITTENEWISRETAMEQKPVLCTTVGYCVEQNDKWIVLAASFQKSDNDNDVSEVTSLPIGVIESITILVEEKA